LDGKDILLSLGYSSNTIKCKYGKIYARLFWGMTMAQVDDFAKTFLLHPLEDTEILF